MHRSWIEDTFEAVGLIVFVGWAIVVAAVTLLAAAVGIIRWVFTALA